MLHLFGKLLNYIPTLSEGSENSTSSRVAFTAASTLLFIVLANLQVYVADSRAGRLFLRESATFNYLLGSSQGLVGSVGLLPVIVTSVVFLAMGRYNKVELDWSYDRPRLGLALVLVLGMTVLRTLQLPDMPGGIAALVGFQYLLGGVLIVYLDEAVNKRGYLLGWPIFYVTGYLFHYFRIEVLIAQLL